MPTGIKRISTDKRTLRRACVVLHDHSETTDGNHVSHTNVTPKMRLKSLHVAFDCRQVGDRLKPAWPSGPETFLDDFAGLGKIDPAGIFFL